jgi:glycosyltransferase involved in cell wall biosynthesis
MENKPLISIALCTYNAGPYLEKQLFSILEQSYENIEIVVVDDCSTDGTYERLEKLKENHPKIRTYKNDVNLGFNKNFEKAIRLCQGEYIAISDQDDIWLPDKLEVLANNIGDNWLIFSNSELIDIDENRLNIQILKPDFSLSNRSFKGILMYNSVTGHTTLFSRPFIEQFLPIPKKGYYDWWMGFVAIYHHRATCINQCLTLHRMHNASVIGKAYSEDKKVTKSTLNTELETQLQEFVFYKNLKEEDKKLIKKIKCSYQKRFSLFFIGLMVFHYPEYFPDLKPRNWFSRLFFALRFK